MSIFLVLSVCLSDAKEHVKNITKTTKRKQQPNRKEIEVEHQERHLHTERTNYKQFKILNVCNFEENFNTYSHICTCMYEYECVPQEMS